MIRAAVLFAGVAGAAAMPGRRVQMESGVHTFSSPFWHNEGKADAAETITAVFSLKHDADRVAAFESRLLQLASPKHADYGKWLSADQVKSMLPADEAGVDIVSALIAEHGIVDIEVGQFRDIIKVNMPIGVASEVFDTEFAKFRSIVNKDVHINRITKPYSLPASVAEHVSVVDDIMRFPTIRERLITPASTKSSVNATDAFDSCGSKCSGFTTPEVLQQRYGYPTITNVNSQSSMSVAEFQAQMYDQNDLDAFDSACGVNAQVDAYEGPANNEEICYKSGCIEALLDIEYMGAIAAPIPLTVVYSKTFSLLDWVDTIMDMSPMVYVHSVSYGNDEVQQTSTEYMDTCNTQFMKAGAMGMSILFASGDQGVWGRTGVGDTFHPDFPAGSPYVTAVGGTNFQEESVVGEESAWSCGGGGFSDQFEMPSWQADAVSSYLVEAEAAGLLPDAKFFNAQGRGYPDVSALGGQTNPYCISYKDGSFSGVAGTSASSPVVAGIFAALNNARFNNGQTALGWLNPFIYSNGACFNDVNDGTSNYCNRGTEGFAALGGWDPATGMGTPIYSCLETAALA
jgi:tripeptidyl-peptidase-1